LIIVETVAPHSARLDVVVLSLTKNDVIVSIIDMLSVPSVGCAEQIDVEIAAPTV